MAKTTSPATTGRKATGRVKSGVASARTKVKTDQSKAASGQGNEQSHDDEGSGPESSRKGPRSDARSEVVEPSGDGETTPSSEKAVSRKELIDQVFQRITGLLQKDGEVSQAMINSLVQLLKLERELIEDEPPHEIRVVWQDTEKVSSDG